MNKEHQKINSIRDSVQNVLTDQVRSLQLVPAAAIKLLQLTTDEDSDIRDLSKVIETEPALATQVIKTVNSVMFNFPHPINSIQRAISILGFSSIRDIAVKLLLYNKLIARPTGQSFDLLFFWQHSLFVATISREIGIRLKYPDPEMLYTAGLLHDIGKLVLETYGKQSYSDFISRNTSIASSTIKNELIFFGVSHEQVGYIYCLDSKIPDLITSIVAKHDSELSDEESLDFAEFKLENAIVAFANYLAGVHGIGSYTQEIAPGLSNSVTKFIDTESLDIESLLIQVDSEMQTTSQFYGIQFPTLNQLRAKLVQTAIQFSQSSVQNLQSKLHPENGVTNLHSSLTIPHQSLDPQLFVPQTLRAIHETFGFDRVFMLSMLSKNRSLIANHCWPQPSENKSDHYLEIKIDTLTGDLLTCLRTRQAAIITSQHFKNRSILNQIGVNEFIAIPILRNKRLCAVLYADNKFSQTPFQTEMLAKLAPIAKELGSALYNARCFELEKNRAEIDPLTGLSNKRMITDFLEQLLSEKERKLERICVGFLDLDYFKKLNDECGHLAGDEALKIAAEVLRNLTRDGDFVGRYGGEEFIFVLPDCTPAEASQYAERIRSDIEAKGIQFKHRFNNNKLTASIGLAMYQPTYSVYSDLITAADKAMYQAKNSGRNQVVFFDGA